MNETNGKIIHIPGQEEDDEQRAITTRIKEMVLERRRLVEEGHSDGVLSDSEIAQIAIKERTDNKVKVIKFGGHDEWKPTRDLIERREKETDDGLAFSD